MNLSEIINFQVACVLLEIKTKFNLEQFKQLEDLNQMVSYAKQHLQLLGEGSARIVFLLSNRYVLKIAHPNAPQKGISQNKSEVDVYTNPKVRPVVAAVHATDPQYKWIISEIVRPLRSQQEFEEITGVSWEMFTTATKNPKQFTDIITDEIEEKQGAIANFQKRLQRATDDKTKQVIQSKIDRVTKQIQDLQATAKSPIVVGALNLVNVANVMPGDINEWDHWGKTADGRLVLYDYGFTKDIVHLYKQAG